MIRNTMTIKSKLGKSAIYLYFALGCIAFGSACLVPLPRTQIVANCEIHGKITTVNSGTPVENVMIFAMYTFNRDRGKNKKPLSFGPFYSDANGRFVIPKFYKEQRYLEHLYMGDCGGSLLFIHPNLGAHSRLICTEDYPPSQSFKDLNVIQRINDEKWTRDQVKYSYNSIFALPEEVQPIAWSHVQQDMRPK